MVPDKESFYKREKIEENSGVADYKENKGCSINDIHSGQSENAEGAMNDVLDPNGGDLSRQPGLAVLLYTLITEHVTSFEIHSLKINKASKLS